MCGEPQPLQTARQDEQDEQDEKTTRAGAEQGTNNESRKGNQNKNTRTKAREQRHENKSTRTKAQHLQHPPRATWQSTHLPSSRSSCSSCPSCLAVAALYVRDLRLSSSRPAPKFSTTPVSGSGRGQVVDEVCLVPRNECADRLVLAEHSAFDEPVCLVKVPSQGLSPAPLASFAAKSSPLPAPRPRR